MAIEDEEDEEEDEENDGSELPASGSLKIPRQTSDETEDIGNSFDAMSISPLRRPLLTSLTTA